MLVSQRTSLSELSVDERTGAGSILDAMRLGLKLVVVPNVSLLDNHQKELAEELEIQGYATKASTE